MPFLSEETAGHPPLRAPAGVPQFAPRDGRTRERGSGIVTFDSAFAPEALEFYQASPWKVRLSDLEVNVKWYSQAPGQQWTPATLGTVYTSLHFNATAMTKVTGERNAYFPGSGEWFHCSFRPDLSLAYFDAGALKWQLLQDVARVQNTTGGWLQLGNLKLTDSEANAAEGRSRGAYWEISEDASESWVLLRDLFNFSRADARGGLPWGETERVVKNYREVLYGYPYHLTWQIQPLPPARPRTVRFRPPCVIQ